MCVCVIQKNKIYGAGPVCFGVKFHMTIKLKTFKPATINRKWKWYNFQWVTCVRVSMSVWHLLMRWEVMHLLIYEAITSFDNSRETQMDG